MSLASIEPVSLHRDILRTWRRETLARLWATEATNQEIAKALGISVVHTYRIAHEMQLGSRGLVQGRYHVWSDADTAYLRDHYPTRKSVKAIAEHIGRSPKAIRERAKQVRLRRDNLNPIDPEPEAVPEPEIIVEPEPEPILDPITVADLSPEDRIRSAIEAYLDAEASAVRTPHAHLAYAGLRSDADFLRDEATALLDRWTGQLIRCRNWLWRVDGSHELCKMPALRVRVPNRRKAVA